MMNKKYIKFSTNNQIINKTGLSISSQESSSTILSLILKDLMVLSIVFRMAHWNIKCSNFYSKHLLYGELYDKNEKEVDNLAEILSPLANIINLKFLELKNNRILTIDTLFNSDSNIYSYNISEIIAQLIKNIRYDINKLDDDVIINYLQELIIKLQHYIFLIQPKNA